MKVLRAGLLAVVALWCAPPPVHADPPPPLKVVASFTILADWTRVVGADDVIVATLVGPDADAHVYEPTPSDVRCVAAADVLIVNGIGFEGWMSRLSSAAGFKGTMVVASRGIRERAEGNQRDPHAWHDLRNAVVYVRNIAQALSIGRPDAASRFSARANAYISELESLDARSRAAFAAIPAERRVAVVSHDAFGYLASTYQVRMLPALGMSTDTEPSAATVGALIRQIRQRQARAVFVENIRDPRLISQIAAEGGAVVGGRLYSDALGAAGSPAATFIDMYSYNVATIVRALAPKPAPGH